MVLHHRERLHAQPGYTSERARKSREPFDIYSKPPDYRRPQCYAGRPGEEPYLLTEKDIEQGTDCEWLYVFDDQQRKLFIRDLNHKEDVAVIDLDGEEPNWTAIECGENFERCHHYAWVHGLLPRTSNLSTQTWLGRRPLEFHDAVAFIIDGKRYASTGCGGNSDYLNRTARQGCVLTVAAAYECHVLNNRPEEITEDIWYFEKPGMATIKISGVKFAKGTSIAFVNDLEEPNRQPFFW